MTAAIRPIAIAVIARTGPRGEEILVFEGKDRATGETFYRPLGGGIDPGESGEEAVVREMREEVGARIEAPRFLGLIENRFGFEGRAHHELVLVYAAELAPGDAERLRGPVIEGAVENDAPLVVLWKPLADVRKGRAILYPDGLLAMIDGAGSAEIVRALWDRIEARDWPGARALLHDDFVAEWPHSRERFRGADAFIGMNRAYPEGWHIEVGRIIAGADGATVASSIVVRQDGRAFHAASLFALRDGKIASAIEHWLEEGGETPPAWRARFAERIEPT